MKQFEYKIIELNLIQNNASFYNDLGKEGWELVTVKSGHLRNFYIFKRELNN